MIRSVCGVTLSNWKQPVSVAMPVYKQVAIWGVSFTGSGCFGIQTAFLCKGAVHDVVVNRKGNSSAIGFVQVAEQFAVCDIDRKNDSSVFVNGIRCFFNCQKGIAFRNRVTAPYHRMTCI